MTSGDKIVQFPSRDDSWRNLERALEDVSRAEQIPEDARLELREWARSAYEEFGRPLGVSLKLSIPAMRNRAEEQVFVNSVTVQIKPFIDECNRRLAKIFLRLIREKLINKKLEMRVSAT